LIPLKALLNFARMKAELSSGDESLLKIMEDPAAATAKSLNDLLAHFGKPVEDLKQFDLLLRVHEAFILLRAMGIPASALIRATTKDPTGETVRDLQAALRARYDAASWRDVIHPINDELRDLQRDALVAYILHHMRSVPKSAHIDAANKLFEYFLTDVQMEPCMQTSRIRHALSSVQLFIERCLMGLEPDVSPDSINGEHWKWMKYYRVWEANRKVFLYPENWLEPELRDDQSPFFKETMSELLQSDITEDSAATALLNYLSKLEEVAKLEPCGIHHVEQDDAMQTPAVDHVIARTSGAHRKYYYRRLDGDSWTPWEQIKLDIEDNPVIPLVWKNEHGSRLLLFWLRIIMQPAMKAPEALPPETNINSLDASKVITGKQPQVTVQAVLSWSEYYNGKWQPTKTSDINNARDLGSYDIADLEKNGRRRVKLVAAMEGNAIRISIYPYPPSSSFLLHNTHSLPEAESLYHGVLTWYDVNSDSTPLRISYWDYPSDQNKAVLERQVFQNTAPGIAVQPWHDLDDPWIRMTSSCAFSASAPGITQVSSGAKASAPMTATTSSSIIAPAVGVIPRRCPLRGRRTDTRCNGASFRKATRSSNTRSPASRPETGARGITISLRTCSVAFRAGVTSRFSAISGTTSFTIGGITPATAICGP